MLTDSRRLAGQAECRPEPCLVRLCVLCRRLSLNAEQLQTLENLPGCAGVKVFTGSSCGELLADDDTGLRRILRHARRRIAVHAEDEARLRERKALGYDADLTLVDLKARPGGGSR